MVNGKPDFICTRRSSDGGGNDPVCIGQGKCTRQTPKAILVELSAKAHRDAFGFVTNSREVWLPQACVHDDSEVFELNGTGKVVVKRWFAVREGLVPS